MGATAGIGRALALAIWELPTKPIVIVAGRRRERLDELVKKGADSGEGRIEGVQIDISGSRESLQNFASDLVARYPDVSNTFHFRLVFGLRLSPLQLDTVIFSAGIQHFSDFKKPETINLDGKIYINTQATP